MRPAEVLELRIACHERHALIQRRAQTLTRVRSHLAQLGIPIAASSLHTMKARQQLADIIEGTA